MLCLATGFTGCSAGTTTIESPKKPNVVGQWKAVKIPQPGPKIVNLDETTIELTKEGHWKVHTGQKIQEGTYEVDGDKIVFTIPLGGGKFLSFSHTIERLTDTELHVKNELGELREFKKQ